MAGALEILRPLLAETGAEPIGTVVMGTVKGDVHDIGKNLVNIMFEGAGFQVIDLGVQVAPEKFVAAIEEHKPDIVGFSAFLTTTMPMFKANINALNKAGLRDKVLVMVGGAPVTQEYADVVGADGYASDASAAVVKAKQLIAARRAARRATAEPAAEPAAQPA
jgi:5-methyltetrahydrofolate--homocysteine methyltransferase